MPLTLVDGKKKRILLRINGTQKKKESKKLDDQEKEYSILPDCAHGQYKNIP